VEALRSNTDRWVDFMMRHELGLEEPDPRHALRLSVAFTLTALLAFGACKGTLTGIRHLRGASQAVPTGGLAAGAAFLIARVIA
jgi:VIT1/CCC1 family predicted Fe2+/Mn2+ transporter